MITLLASAGVLAALTGYALAHRTRWAGRGIVPAGGWPPTITAQTVAALAAVPYVETTWGSGPALAAAAFVWLGVLAILTDIATRKVPWDVSHPVALVGVAAFALNYTPEAALAFGTALVGVVGIPLAVRALTRKGLGMSDVRVLWAATATMSWWVGQTWLLYALIVACLIQLLVRMAAGPLNWGDMVPTCPDRPAPADGGPVAMRRELPFAPALVVGLLACTAWGTHLGYGACQMWNVLGAC